MACNSPNRRAGEKVLWVKCLLHKHEDPDLAHQHPCKNLERCTHTHTTPIQDNYQMATMKTLQEVKIINVEKYKVPDTVLGAIRFGASFSGAESAAVSLTS